MSLFDVIHATRRASYSRTPASGCPFCLGGDEVPALCEGPFLLPNRFPFVDREATGRGHGINDLLIPSVNHFRNLVHLDSEEMSDLLALATRRCAEMVAEESLRFSLGFQVSGSELGATVDHPHLHLLGLSFVPRIPSSGPFPPDPIGAPLDERAVLAEEGALAYVPEDSRVPYEVTLCPPSPPEGDRFTPRSHQGLASALRRVLRALEGLLGPSFPYILLVLPTLPEGGGGPVLQLLPCRTPSGRVKHFTALEVGFGIHINPVLPSRAALEIRNQLSPGSSTLP